MHPPALEAAAVRPSFGIFYSVRVRSTSDVGGWRGVLLQLVAGSGEAVDMEILGFSVWKSTDRWCYFDM
jgi:hypothetical protein